MGVSTRKVDDLLKALGPTGIDRSKVSRICKCPQFGYKAMDELVEGFRNRSLDGEYPYLWLDGLYLKMRQDHRIVSQATVIAIGVREKGERNILRFSLDASDKYAVWLDFLRSLVHRGLKGVWLVTSDTHERLRAAIDGVLVGAAWQRCQAPCKRDAASELPRKVRREVHAGLRDVFGAPNGEFGQQRAQRLMEACRQRFPQLVA